MLDLDDEGWSSLGHAYGAATNVPNMLRDLAASPRLEMGAPLGNDLWSALCHQGTVYTASIAAFPHVVAIAARLEPDARAPYLHFVGAIAGSRDQPSSPPGPLEEPFLQAMEEAQILLGDTMRVAPGDWHERLYLLLDELGLRRVRFAYSVLDRLTSRELESDCPHCETAMFVVVDDAGWWATTEDYATQEVRHRTEVTPPATLESEGDWTDRDAPERVAKRCRELGWSDLARDVSHLRSIVTCPDCGESFELYKAALRDEGFSDE